MAMALQTLRAALCKAEAAHPSRTVLRSRPGSRQEERSQRQHERELAQTSGHDRPARQ
jgi:hypothetical protein